MATGGDGKGVKKPDVQLIDIEDIARKWAWSRYQEIEDKKQKRLRQKHEKLQQKGQACLDLFIDWSRVTFVDSTHWVSREKAGGDSTANATDSSSTGKQTGDDIPKEASKDVCRQDSAPVQGKPGCSVLFRTTYTNDTNKEQTYTLNTTKTTCSACEVSVENGFTRGMEFSVGLKAPGEVLEANAGFSHELSLTKSQGQTLEEEVTWSVESQITVQEHHHADATLEVVEHNYDDRFTVKTTMRGYVFARFNNLLDNNSLVLLSNRNIFNIMRDFCKAKSTCVSEKRVELDKDNEIVTINTSGSCKFKYGVKQDVRVTQRPIEPGEQKTAT